MKRVKILGTGSYLPKKIMTNNDWAELVDTSDEWITSRTGIKKRHFAAEDETTSDMMTNAAKKAIEDAGIEAEEIDLIIAATVTGDNAYPSTACWIHKKLGIQPVPAFDISAGCTGFLYAAIIGEAMVKAGTAKTVLITGGETMSRAINWEDRNTCVLFGDGAGAAVLRASDSEQGIMSHCWGADGNLGNLLIQPAGGSAMPASAETVEKCLHSVYMEGNKVFKHAVLRMEESAVKAITDAGLKSEDIDLFIPHQANMRIIEATIKRAGIPMSRTFVNIEETANISAGTVPIALDQARRSGRIKEGDNVLLAAFGAGLTWSGMTIRF